LAASQTAPRAALLLALRASGYTCEMPPEMDIRVLRRNEILVATTAVTRHLGATDEAPSKGTTREGTNAGRRQV
jgi:hypothetical protein